MADMTKIIEGAVREATGPEIPEEPVDTGAESGEETTETSAEGGSEGTEGAEGDEEGAQEGAEGAQEGEKPAEGAEGAPAGTKPAGEALKAEDEAFLKEHGLQLPAAGQKPNRIPYPRVVKITENAQRKVAELVLGETIPKDKPIGDVLTAVKARLAEFTTMGATLKAKEAELEHVARGEDIMVNQPERFLAILPSLNPRYAELIKGGGAVTKPDKPVEPAGEMPEPDLDLGNGQKTYSIGGVQKLIKWVAASARQEVLAEVDTRFKPVMTEFEQQQRMREALPRLQARVDHARANWPGFTEHEAEILALLQADQKIGFEDAYAKVLHDAHEKALAGATTNRETMRQDLLKEMKAKPTSTATTSTTKPTKVEEVVQPGETATLAAIRKAVRAHKA